MQGRLSFPSVNIVCWNLPFRNLNSGYRRKRHLLFFMISTYQAWRTDLKTSVPLISFDFSTKTSRTSSSQWTDGRTEHVSDTHTHTHAYAHPYLKALIKRWREHDSIGVLTNNSTALSSSHYFLSSVRTVLGFCVVLFQGRGLFSGSFKCHLTVYVVSRGLL